MEDDFTEAEYNVNLLDFKIQQLRIKGNDVMNAFYIKISAEYFSVPTELDDLVEFVTEKYIKKSFFSEKTVPEKYIVL